MKETHKLKVRDLIPIVGKFIYEHRTDDIVDQCDDLLNLPRHAFEKKELNASLHAMINQDYDMLFSLKRAKEFANRSVFLSLYNRLLLTSLAAYGVYSLVDNLIN